MVDPKNAGTGGESSAPSSIPIRINKQLESEADNEIETRPTYINHLVFARTGTNVFLDLGIVPTDDLLQSKDKQELRFIVLDRFVMGLETFMELHDAINGLYDQLNTGGVLPSEKVITTPKSAI